MRLVVAAVEIIGLSAICSRRGEWERGERELDVVGQASGQRDVCQPLVPRRSYAFWARRAAGGRGLAESLSSWWYTRQCGASQCCIFDHRGQSVVEAPGRLGSAVAQRRAQRLAACMPRTSHTDGSLKFARRSSPIDAQTAEEKIRMGLKVLL